MALTPLEDKSAIKAIIDTDSYIINDLGFTPRNVLVYDETDEEVTGDTKFIYIVNYPSPVSKQGGDAIVVYGIECVTHKSFQGNALRAMQRIVELLNCTDIGNNHVLDMYEQITQLTAPSGTIRYGIAVKFETTIPKVKVSNKINI